MDRGLSPLPFPFEPLCTEWVESTVRVGTNPGLPPTSLSRQLETRPLSIIRVCLSAPGRCIWVSLPTQVYQDECVVKAGVPSSLMSCIVFHSFYILALR